MIDHPGIDIALICLSVVPLWKGAQWVVLSAAHIAQRLGLSELVIGLTIVALGTSAPEFVVTVLAALEDQPEISVGNVVGSNIFNTGLLLGLCAGIWTVPVTRALVRRDIPLLLASAALLLVFLSDRRIAGHEGLGMFLLLVAYLTYLIRRRTHPPAELEELSPGTATARDVPRLLLGLACVIGGAELMVRSATSIAEALGVSPWLIGVTIVAAGTSLPELATSLAAAHHGRRAMIAGNLIGSDLFNVLGVLGVAALLNPLAVEESARYGVGMMFAAVAVLWLLAFRRGRLSHAAGIVLIALALARWGLDLTRLAP